MDREDVTVVVPAYNEASRIGSVIDEIPDEYATLVVDDASRDDTVSVAREAGATVVEHDRNRGYLAALRTGFAAVETEFVVTLDADGEHDPADIDRLLEPIARDDADLVFGAREEIPRPSERLLNFLATRVLPLTDTGTGFRALRTDLAKRLELDTACTCGTFALEAASLGARVDEVPSPTRSVAKPRGIAWKHAHQLFHLFRYLIRSSGTGAG
ncbi:MAG: glycosyltransferase family 2 protein [Halanaeroarchaeum sp.]